VPLMRRRIMAFVVLVMMALGVVAGSAPFDSPEEQTTVTMCHKGKTTINVPWAIGLDHAVDAHLNHGDTIGACD